MRLPVIPRLGPVRGLVIANVVNNGVAFAISVLVARTNSPAAFGKFSLALATATWIALVLDAGMSVSLVRMYQLKDDVQEREGVARTLVATQVLVAGTAVCAGMIGLAMGAWGASETGLVWGLALPAAGLLSLWSVLRAVEQARRDFRALQRYVMAYAAFRAVGGLYLFLTGGGPELAFAILYPVPLAALGVFTLVRQHRLPGGICRGMRVAFIWEALRYGPWVAISGVAFNGLVRLPQFSLARAGAHAELGLYGAAVTFLAVFALLNDAVRIVLLPDAAGARTSQARGDFLERLKDREVTFIGVMAVGAVVCAAVQYVVLGAAYRESVPSFIVLAGATILTIVIGLRNMLIHAHGRPGLEAATNALRLVVLAVVLAIVPSTAMSTAASYATVLLGGELVLMSVVRYLERGALG